MTANVLANSSAAHSALPCRRCYQQPRPVAARPKTRLKVSASAFGALSSDSFGGPSTGSILSQAASVVGIAAAAWFAARYADTSGPREGPDNTAECPRCEGTGEVECPCTRWSDGDVGCASCRGTGRSPCPACGGGGTAVPVTARVVSRSNIGFRGQQ